jgi:hypothetical protein
MPSLPINVVSIFGCETGCSFVFCFLVFRVSQCRTQSVATCQIPLASWRRENEAEAVLIGYPPQKANMTRKYVEEPAGRPFLHILCLQSYGYQVDVVVVGR